MKTTQTILNQDSAHHGKVNQESQTFFSGQLNGSGSFFSPVIVQPKLKIGAPDDQYESQADRVAEAVVSSPAPNIQQESMEEEEETLQLKCSECEKEEEIQMKSETGQSAGTAPSAISQKIQTARGGSHLPESVNSEMSKKMGADFSDVNIHKGPEASRLNQSLGARAFTHGTDVFFNSGEYNPGSREGKRLLAHELTHVVQQGKINERVGDIQKFENDQSETPLPNPRPDVIVEGPHIVTGNVDPRRRDEIERRRSARLLSDVNSWVENRGRRQQGITEYFGEWNSGIREMISHKNEIISAYSSARTEFTNRIGNANQSAARRRTLVSIMMGALPGFGTVTGSLRVSTLGLGFLIDGFYSSAISRINSEVTSPLTQIQNQIFGAQDLPEANAESADHFDLRLTESLRVIQEEISRISMLSGVMGRDDFRIECERIGDELRGNRNPADQIIEEASRIQSMERVWHLINQRILNFHRFFSSSWGKLQGAKEYWTNRRLETMLWIVYLANLPDDSSIDDDTIENRLIELNIIGQDGSNSYLGLDFGDVTDPLGVNRDTWVAIRHAQTWENAIQTSVQNLNISLSREALTLRSSLTI